MAFCVPHIIWIWISCKQIFTPEHNYYMGCITLKFSQVMRGLRERRGGGGGGGGGGFWIYIWRFIDVPCSRMHCV